MDPILLKTLAAVVLGFAISAILGKFLVPALRRWKAGQSIKEDGPTWHMSKQGTPTMGGLMFIAAVVVVVLVLNGPAILAGDLTSVFVLLLALVFGLIGFVTMPRSRRRRTRASPPARSFSSSWWQPSCSSYCCGSLGFCPPTSMSPSLGWSGSCPGWCT